MNTIEYINLSEVNITELLTLLNKEKVRKHLIDHESFSTEAVTLWVEEKNRMDSLQGCRVRAILIDKQLAGWCGIQHEEGNYEIAIVLDDAYWGAGKEIFRELVCWAKEFGHKTVFIHFFYTRPEYKFLRRISKNVFETKMLGSKFTTYELLVDEIS